MLRFKIVFIVIALTGFRAFCQELYPLTEPASNTPKGVWGLRLMGDTHDEYGTDRNYMAMRLLYGVTSNFSVWAQASFSNHHDKNLPQNLITHTHSGNNTLHYINQIPYGNEYPYLFGGVQLYGKYRFYSFDGQQTHLRMALYGQYSSGKTAHDEAEPSLNGDNAGYGTGIIITQLYHRLAVSLTSGFIFPEKYTEVINLGKLYGYATQETIINYGRSINYSLSFGYLLYPSTYTSYKQDNYNIYLELLGKSYPEAEIIQDNHRIEVLSPPLKANHYMDAYLGLQRIASSNTRMELAIGFPFVKRSYTHFYPVFNLAVQHYFFRK